MLAKLPTVSLVTCSYQQARFLESTIRSVLNQNYPALEYIIVDGGSTDGSNDIIKRYEDSLAWWISEPDKGQTDALIKGFAHATGEICGWLCSDDILLPDALIKIAGFFRDHPHIQAVYGDSLWIDINGEPIKPKREMSFNRFVFLHDHNYVPQPSMFWRRGLYDKVGGLCADFNIAMDNDLWEKFSAHTRIFHLPEYLSCMRYYSQQKTLSRELRPQGYREGTIVMERGSALARYPILRPALHLCARSVRLVQRIAAGGYDKSIPSELVPWLKAHSTYET
ncbi:glycosyltransferase family 2 protein [Oxalobacteraceae bacterium R-40]|uniref:Glycosyltransferase family 2 protein n=1 Tax=Keguizhuia sedimenti TaxID=3064264 RepID=A0ABU1BL44_9BURK|nr:glycosyltransferase family 2 protein [Oxalobacteraceae bacterium R-40]